MIRKKGILIILDGLADRPIPELDNLTPLEYAKTPNFDYLIRNGISGLVYPAAPGVRVGTDVGILGLFGYNPFKVYWGRGPIEAVGAGLVLNKGDVAVRCNFATVDEEFRIIDRRAGRIRSGTNELAKALDGMKLDDDVVVNFKEGTEHRAVAIFRGNELSAEITDSDPGIPAEGKKIKEVKAITPGFTFADKTAFLFNQFIRKSYEILKNHPVNQERIKNNLLPANILITRGAGMKMKVRKIAERFNINASAISGETVVIGIAKIAGFNPVTKKGMTSNIDTDLELKINVALQELEKNDFVILHIKGTDIAGHDNQPLKKMEFIQKIDSFIGVFLDNIKGKDDIYIACSSDHATPCRIRDHTADPVPSFIWGKDLLTDNVTSFGERNFFSGGLGKIRSNEFILTLLDFMGVTYKLGS
ncbi:phosphoglycerate mutase [candidate division KSB1 bacterium]|nr:MAG: phosphoglycerate mutase [candidate division KSB1 bacterium]